MDPSKDTEAELESFRRQWQEEVSQRARQGHTVRENAPAPASTSPERQRRVVAPPKTTEKRIDPRDEEVEPRGYHDLPDKEAELKLAAAEQGFTRGASSREPKSALEHYEKAVEKEATGSLGDSLKLYRKAFKMDDSVHEKYKNKHFPPSSFKPKAPQATATGEQGAPTDAPPIPLTISELLEEFSQLSIPGADPPTDLSPPPPCPIAELPEEILASIIQHTAIADVATMSRLSRVCKRFAYLVMTEEQVWRRVVEGSESGFGAMLYDYSCDLQGKPLVDNEDGRILDLDDDDSLDEGSTPPTPEKPSLSDVTINLLHKQYKSSWRQMFRSRPRIRFGGCYISTVNYTRPGAASTNTTTWGAPVHIVTYFRYLRFFRDGSAISLLTTAEPVDVVHHLKKENLTKEHRERLPSSVMKDALRGRWRLSGPGDGIETDEAEGDVHVETEGVTSKYMWKMQFGLANAGRNTRNNKLNWKGFWYYNRLADDWGEFGLKNDKAYYWSRVKSYGEGL